LIEPVAVEPIASVETESISAQESEPQQKTEDRAEEQLDAFPHEPTLGENMRVEEFAHDDASAELDEEDVAPVDVLNLFDRGQHAPEVATSLKPLRKFFARKDSIVVAELEPEAATPQEVLIVNVLCKEPEGFKGPDLLQLLLACDLRYGKKNIFHRYEKANAKGAIQFSVANLVEPGTFNLDAIDDFTTPGVSFFLSLPGPEKPLTAFNYMIETAQVLVRHLHAELRDDAHSVMTAQTIEHCRQRIRDFERKQLTLQL
jgi:cell division protein ZipA